MEEQGKHEQKMQQEEQKMQQESELSEAARVHRERTATDQPSALQTEQPDQPMPSSQESADQPVEPNAPTEEKTSAEASAPKSRSKTTKSKASSDPEKG